MVHEVVDSIWNKEELLQQWKESVFVSSLSITKVIKGL
jgi:hypothetical protein